MIISIDTSKIMKLVQINIILKIFFLVKLDLKFIDSFEVYGQQKYMSNNTDQWTTISMGNNTDQQQSMGNTTDRQQSMYDNIYQ